MSYHSDTEDLPPPAYESYSERRRVPNEEKAGLYDDEDALYDAGEYGGTHGYAPLGHNTRAPQRMAPPARKRLFVKNRVASSRSKCVTALLLLASVLSISTLVIVLLTANLGYTPVFHPEKPNLTNTPPADLDTKPHKYAIPVPEVSFDTKTDFLSFNITGAASGNFVVVPNTEDNKYRLEMNVSSEDDKVARASAVVVQEFKNRAGHKGLKIISQGPKWENEAPLRVLAKLHMPYNSNKPLSRLLVNGANLNVFVQGESELSGAKVDVARFGTARITTVGGKVTSSVPLEAEDIQIKTGTGDIDIVAHYEKNLKLFSMEGKINVRKAQQIVQAAAVQEESKEPALAIAKREAKPSTVAIRQNMLEKAIFDGKNHFKVLADKFSNVLHMNMSKMTGVLEKVKKPVWLSFSKEAYNKLLRMYHESRKYKEEQRRKKAQSLLKGLVRGISKMVSVGPFLRMQSLAQKHAHEMEKIHHKEMDEEHHKLLTLPPVPKPTAEKALEPVSVVIFTAMGDVNFEQLNVGQIKNTAFHVRSPQGVDLHVEDKAGNAVKIVSTGFTFQEKTDTSAEGVINAVDKARVEGHIHIESREGKVAWNVTI